MSSEPDATAVRRITRAGDYDLLRKMGSGGFGVVYEARHRQTGLLYALKRVELTVEDAERFRKEALYPAQIASRSLHVLGVHSFFHDPVSDAFYLVTELIPHGDLKTFMAQRPKPLPLNRAVHLGSGIAKGLAAIHALGIVHRDLKPANVLMDKKDGQWVPKIADFGLARSHSSISLGEFASCGYAAPEQLDLMSDRPVGPEADMFSFGTVLYELLTGERPSPATDLREYGRWIRARRQPPPPSTIRPELARYPQIDVLLAALIEFDPARRTMTAVASTRVLQEVLIGLSRPDMPRHEAPPPIPPPTPIPTPVATPAPAPPPPPTPVPAPAPVPAPTVPVQPLLIQPGPPVPPTPLITPAPKPKSKARRIAWIALAAAVVVIGVMVGGGWWGYQFWNLRDAASRGQAAFEKGDFSKAGPILREAATAGDAGSQAMLGEIYGLGLGRPTDFKEARYWFELSANQDHPTGLAGLGWSMLLGNGGPAMPERGVVYLRRAADRGDAMGHAFLGQAYETGTGIDKDEAEAARHYRTAAGQRFAMASYRLGLMYRDGRGVPKSVDNAVSWSRSAAELGYYNAMCLLGNLLGDRWEEARAATRFGQVSDADAKEAVSWYRKAANDDIACGELGLGYMHYYGYGVPESYDQAVTLYERAAGHGSETAKANLTRALAGWVLPPMYLGAWRQVSGPERRDEIKRLRDAGVIERLGAQDVRRLRRIEIDFYESATLFELEIARAGKPVGIYTYIRRGDRLVHINGRSDQIHELSASAPIRIDTMSRAIAFLRFFMAAIQSQDQAGTFRLVDDASDVPWLPSASDQDRSGVAAQISPVSVTPSSSGGWQAIAAGQHGNALFRASLWLKPNGGVEMLRDEPIGTMLPIAQERFDEQGLRVRASS